MRRATLPAAPALRAFLICLILLSIAQAVNPPPGGGYPGENTAAGTNALFRMTDGTDNTALGSWALQNDTDGQSNTAAGTGALDGNRSSNQNTGTGLLALASNRFDNGPDNTAYGYRALDETNGIGIQPSVGTRFTLFLKALTTSPSVTRPVEISSAPTPSISTLATSVSAGDNRVVRIGDTASGDQPLSREFLAGQ